MFYVRWADAQELVETEEAGLREALAALGAATQTETRALAEEARLAEGMGPLREGEAKRAAVVGRLRLEHETFELEARRSMDRVRELSARSEQLGNDISREDALIAEAQAILSSLDAELATIATAEAGADEAEDSTRSRRAVAEAEVKAAEAQLGALATQVAERRAKLQSLEASRAERAERVARLGQQLSEFDAETREIAGRAPDAAKLAQITDAGKRLAEEITRFEVQALAAESATRTAPQWRPRRASAARAHTLHSPRCGPSEKPS